MFLSGLLTPACLWPSLLDSLMSSPFFDGSTCSAPVQQCQLSSLFEGPATTLQDVSAGSLWQLRLCICLLACLSGLLVGSVGYVLCTCRGR